MGRDSHLHVEELDGDVPVPVACMHCRESTRTNLVAEPERGKFHEYNDNVVDDGGEPELLVGYVPLPD